MKTDWKPSSMMSLDIKGYETQQYTSSKQFVNAFIETDGEYSRTPVLGAFDVFNEQTEPLTIKFKIQRVDDSYSLYYQCDKITGNDFRLLKTHSNVTFTEPKIGLIASFVQGSNSPASSSLVEFDNFEVETFTNDLRSDDFADGKLGSSWNIMNKTANLTVTDGSVNIQTETGEWYATNEASYGNYAVFGINVKKSGYYKIYNRVANGEDSVTVQMLEHCLELDGNFMASYIMNPTGGWQNWVDTSVKTFYLTEGFHRLRFLWKSNMNLNYISISPANQAESDAQAVADAKDLIDSTSADFWNIDEFISSGAGQVRSIICEKVNVLLASRSVFADIGIKVSQNDISIGSYEGVDYSDAQPMNGLYKFSVTVNAGESFSDSNVRSGIVVAGPSHDINQDDEVNIKDLVKMKKVLAEIGENYSNPDLNSDGSANSMDATIIRKTILNKD